MEKQQQPPPPPPHFLIASYPAQGHINPALRLAKRLASQAPGACITFSTAVSAHRRMFPSDEDRSTHRNGLFAYIPFSNGYDDGFDASKHDVNTYLSQSQHQGSMTLAAIVDDFASSGRPVTCIIYSFFMSWVSGVARHRGIPSFLYWIQSATVFGIYWHYFHDYGSVIAANAGNPSGVVNLPGLPLMRTRDLPSFITANSPDDPYAVFIDIIRDMFVTLDSEIGKPRVIANTADELETSAIASVADKVDIIGIGPLLDVTEGEERSLFKASEKKEYMEWLDKQEERSVVYVSFGSLSAFKKEQAEEIRRGLRESGRPYLWVVRKDNRREGMELEDEEEGQEKKKGMVVEWCSQVKVLEHRAVGCFVTHSGWNSTVESLMCGVPTVAVPQWTDQLTNAWLMERAWGTGVRAEVSEDGLLEAGELRRCLENVMGEGEGAEEIRRKMDLWKGKAREATIDGGSSHRNLKDFVEKLVSI